MIGYADTSFLVSLYLPDAHSPAAWAAMKSRPYLYLTPDQRQRKLAKAEGMRVVPSV